MTALVLTTGAHKQKSSRTQEQPAQKVGMYEYEKKKPRHRL
jgi:hypothetical protein